MSGTPTYVPKNPIASLDRSAGFPWWASMHSITSVNEYPERRKT